MPTWLGWYGRHCHQHQDKQMGSHRRVPNNRYDEYTTRLCDWLCRDFTVKIMFWQKTCLMKPVSRCVSIMCFILRRVPFHSTTSFFFFHDMSYLILYTDWRDFSRSLVFTISLSKQNRYIKQILNALLFGQ